MAEVNLITNIYQKGTTGSTAIGVNGENVSLETGNSSVNQPNILPSVTNTSAGAIYYDNVQAQMYRKGFQINNLNSTVKDLKNDLYGTEGSSTTPTSNSIKGQIQSLASSLNNYVPISTVDGADYNEETGKYTLPNSEIMTKASTVSVRKIRNIGNLDTISVPDTNLSGGLATWLNVTTQEAQKLHTILPYLAAANPILEHPSSSGSAGTFEGWDINPSTMAGSVGTRGGATEEQVTAYRTALRSVVERNDGLLNIAKKYNSLYTYVQNNSNDLIQRYYTQKERFKVYDSNINVFPGYPTYNINQQKLSFDGHMRYLPYEQSLVNTVSGDTYVTTFSTVQGWGAAISTYQGPAIVGRSNNSTVLLDKDKLPTPPKGYRWECVYARGTYQIANRNELWQVLDGYRSFNAFLLNSHWNTSELGTLNWPHYVNFKINIPNLYKGTTFDNFDYAYQTPAQFASATLNSVAATNTGEQVMYTSLFTANQGFQNDAFIDPSVPQSATIPTQLYFLTPSTHTDLYCGGHTSNRYTLFRRIDLYKRGQITSPTSSDRAFKQVGTINSPTNDLEVSLLYNTNPDSTWSWKTYFIDPYLQGPQSTVDLRERATTVLAKNFFTTLIFKEPFKYAEYVLVQQNQSINPFKLFDNNSFNSTVSPYQSEKITNW